MGEWDAEELRSLARKYSILRRKHDNNFELVQSLASSVLV